MSDLKSRIEIKENTFWVIKEQETDRKAYYNCFTLAEEIAKNKENPVNYFAAMEKKSDIKVDKDSLVCVCEYEGDKLVDEAHIYCSSAGNPVITWNIEPAPSYEVADPYKITISWEGHGETIRSSHVTLYCKKDRNAYAFLTDKIIPEEGRAEFIISVPEGYSPEDLEVHFDDDVQLKYQIRKG